jgi:hypothetical protein
MFVLPAVAFPQGSGVAPPSDVNINSIYINSISNNPTAQNPFAVTRTVVGKVTKIGPGNRLIVLEAKDSKSYEFRLGDKLRLKAEKGTEFAGRNDLVLSDFQAGQFVKVTYIVANNTVTELKMRRTLK